MAEYADRNRMELGETYVKHVGAMTSEGLHNKSDIAAELAWRDIQIERLRKIIEYAEVCLDQDYSRESVSEQLRAALSPSQDTPTPTDSEGD